jgi:autotransporter-associated beta strand protein
MKTKMNQISSKILLTVCAMFAILAILAAPGAFAANQTDTWTGSASLNLGDAGNWTGGNAPPIAGDSWVFGQAGLGATLNNSFSGGMTVSNLTFNGPSAFIFNSAVNPIIVTNFLTNASTAVQTFNTAFSNTGPVTLTLTAGGGDLTINGNLNNNTSLTLAGTGGNLTLTDTNNFTGALTIGTNNTLTLSGPTAALGTNNSAGTFTYGGAITENGTLVYSSSLNQTNTGVISGGGATPGLVINGPGVFALGNMNNSFTNNIVVNGGRLSATAGTYTGARANGALGNQYIDGRTLTINPGGVLSLESANVFASSGTPNHLTIYNNSYMQLIGSGEDELFTNLYLNAATNYVFITNGNWYYPCAIFGGSVNVSGSSPTYFTAGTFGTGSGSTSANGGNGCGWGLGYTGSSGYQTPFNVAVTAGGSGSGGADLIISATLYNMANQASIPSGILMNGPGTMLLSGSNLFTGPITVSAGSLIVGNAGYLNSNSFPGSITVNSGASFAFSSSAAQTFAGAINNSGAFTYSGSSSGTFTGAINNNSSFAVSSAAPVLFETPSFSGTGTLAINGPGTTYILANTSYSGLTTVNGGELALFSSQANTAPVTVKDGATLAVIASPGGVTGFSPATLTVGSATGANVQVVINSTTQAPLTVGALNLTGNNNTFTVNASVALAASQSYPVLSYATTSGPALTQANFVKPAGITGSFTSTSSAGVTTWSLNVAPGGVASPLTWTGVVNTGSYGLWDIATTANWKSGGSAVDYVDGDPVLFDDTASFFVVGGVGAVSPSGVTFNNSANNYGLLGTAVISGTGGITLKGSGFVTNSAVDTYSGATAINNGTFVAGTNSVGLGGPLGAFYAPVSIANSATAALNLNSFSAQVGSLSGGGATGGNVALGSGTLTVGADGTSQTYGGVISGSGGLSLTGAGSLTLLNTNVFSGGLKVGALNTLTLSGPTAAIGTLANAGGGTYAGAIADNGWIVYSTSLNQTNSGAISGGGGIILNGPGTLTLNNNTSSFTNNIVINGGLLSDTTGENGAGTGVGANNVVGRQIIINNGGTFSCDNSGGNDFSGGTGPSQIVIVINQGGLLRETSGNTWVTNILLNGGTMLATAVANAGATWPEWNLGGSIIVGGTSPSTMSAAAAGTTTSGVGYSLGAGASVGYQTPFVVNPTAGGSLAGGADLIVSGTMYNSDANGGGNATGFIKSGSGTMLVSGTNFFAGPITVSAGTLNLSGAGMLGNAATLLGGNYAGAINIASGGTFLFTSTMGQTNSGVISGAGNLVVSNTSGPGLALSNNVNTLSGSVVIGAGTLFLEGSASLANASTIAISNGATFDVSQVTRVSGAGTGQNIIGFGTVNGNFTTPANALIEGGVPGNAGTLAFNGNLTLGNASGFRAVLSTSATAGPNSLVTVSGSLAFLGAQIHVVAPAGQDLDTQDYTLVTATGGLGSSTFSPAVIWDVAPANANQYFVEISGNSLVLHYSSVPLPIPGGTTSPSTVLRNQTPQIVVTVVPGQAGSTVNSVTVDTSSIGGPNNLSLTAGAGNTWTGSVFISPTNLVGTYLLPATAVDSTQTTGYGDVTVFIVASTETWAGAGSSPWDFDTAANWAIETGETAAYAPGYIGDSLIFAGKTGPSPVMDNSYSVNGLGFASGAGPFNITATSTNILTITGGTTNLSSATNTLALPVLSGTTGPLSINAGSGVLALTKGLADENGGLTVIGSSGNFALSGNSTFTGPLVVQQGTMTLTGPTAANTNAVILANASGSNAVLTIGSGGSMNITNTGLPSGSWGTDLLVLNEATNATGILNLNSGGNFTTALALATGNGSGGYSYVNMTGGTLQLGSFFYAGGSGYDTARVDISGGTLNILSNCISVSGGAYSNTNSHGLMNFSGNAVLNSAQSEGPDFQYGGRGGLFVGEFGPAVLNVMGNAILNVYGDTNVVMGVWNFAGANGTINLLGGAIVTAQVSGGSGHSTFNFNGGLLSNYAGSINWSGLGTATTSVQGPAFMFNVNNSYVYSGGAVIDDGGAAITINEPLQAPAGYGIGTAGGVGSILPKAKGSGYIAPPVVLISGGTGIGAMANAVVSGGQVTGYTVTCPGTGYSASDTLTVTLLGGGGSGATATNAPLVLNTSGGLIYSSAPGGGSLTLSAPATYTGPTVAKSGRLTVGTGGSILNSTVFAVSNGAIMDFSQVGGLALGNTYLLEGSGIVNGKVTANAGAKIYPGTDPVIGTLTLNSGLNMVLGSIATFDLTNSGVLGSSNDQVVVAGTGSLNFANNTIHIKSINGAALDTNNAYTLFQNNSSALAGLPSVTPVFDVAPANASTGHWLIQPQGNNIVLMNSATAAPNGSGSITAGGTGSPATNIIRNTSINVTVTAATAVSVSMDLSSYGGSQYTFTPGSGGTWTATGVAIPAGMPPGPITLPIVIFDGTLYGNVALAVNILTTADVWSGADFNNSQVADDNANWQHNVLGVSAAPGYVGDSVIFQGTTGLTPIFEQYYTFNGIGFASGAGQFILSSSAGSVSVTGGITNNAANVETVNMPLTLTGANAFFTGASTGTLVLGNAISGSGQMNVAAGAGGVTMNGTVAYNGNTFIATGGSLILGPTGQYQDPVLGTASFGAPITNNGSLVFSNTTTMTMLSQISGSGTILVGGPGTICFSNVANLTTNDIIVNGGTLLANAGTYTGGRNNTALGNIYIDGRTITINNGGTLMFDSPNVFPGGNIANNLTWIVNKGGTVGVEGTGENEVFSNVFLNGGTMNAIVGNGNTWPSFIFQSSVTVGGTTPSTLSAASAGTTANGVGFALGMANGPGYQTPFIVNQTAGGSLAGGADLIVSGTLYNCSQNPGNANGFTKSGLGTMLLSGTNLFTGNISVTAGTVIEGNAGNIDGGLYAGNIAISSGATFAFGSSQFQTNSGAISGAGTLLVNNGTGSGLVLSNSASTLTGPVVITNAGTLFLIAGSSLGSPSGISIAGGATFDVSQLASPYVWPAGASATGSGTAGSAATINSAGAVTIGSSSSIILNNYDGTDPGLTINGSLTLGGANQFVVNGAALAPGQYSLIYASGGITDPAGYPPVTGTAIGPTSSGSISVSGNSVVLTVTAINAAPPPIQFSLSGKVLTLNWPTNSGWTLQSNSINIAVPGDWYNVPGSSAVTTFPININTANKDVFYRLVLP